MPAINILFAALFGAGIFGLIMSLNQPRKISLTELERISGHGDVQRGFLGEFQYRLEAAHLNTDLNQFILISLGLGFALGGLAFLLSNAPLAGLLGFGAGSVLYWAYLNHKATRELEAYEDALPHVMARLRAGAEIGGSLESAAVYTAEFGPVVSREDWRYIAAQLKTGVEPQIVFDEVAAKRGSLLLNTIFELIAIQVTRKVGLSKALAEVEESLRERVKVMKRARTLMRGPIRELSIVCLIPFVVVFLLRLVAPGYASAYSSLAGQVLLLAGWGICLAAFAFGYHSFSQGLQEETNFGGVAADRADVKLRAGKETSGPVTAQPIGGGGDTLQSILGQE